MNVEKPSNELAAYIKNLQAENVVIKTSDIKELLTNNGLFNLTESEINEIIKNQILADKKMIKVLKQVIIKLKVLNYALFVLHS